MSAPPPAPIHFGREIDYLEDLGAKLRNLQGFATLAHELLQNADDVSGVTTLTFNICQHALIVENDGKFSDCGHPETVECEWRERPANGSHRCDFHRFRLVAGADKRNEAGTTGAFGIGFISVYQITDRPELISSRHWILDETQQASQRITQCSGCADCKAVGLPATRFILPWASDPASRLRKSLRAEPTTAETPANLLAELERSLPTAMLFLKKLAKVEIRQGERLLRRLERVPHEDSIILADGDPTNDRVWYLVRGNFSAKATELRGLHPNRIEQKRSADVIIAIPESALDSGLLCATLPTQQSTGLPFHINADFYPSEDRKRIIAEHDYQSAWNRAALDAAATLLADSLSKVKSWLGHQRLWALLARLHQSAAADANRREQVFAQFWIQLAPSLAVAEVIYTQQKQWRKPPEVFYLQQETERAALPVLESVGLSFVHQDLRPYQNIFTATPISVRTLALNHVAQALDQKGLTRRYPEGAWPEFLAATGALRALWDELEVLFNRRAAAHQNPQHRDALLLASLSLAVNRDGALCPCNSVYRTGTAETQNLFLRLDPSISFASAETNSCTLFVPLCPAFGPAQAVSVILNLGQAAFAAALGAGSVTVPDLISWFVDHRTEILRDPQLKAAVAALPIFPSAREFQPLTALSLPGKFQDPLQLASLLDVSVLPKHHDFLRELGIEELSFPVYASQHLIHALRRSDLPEQKRREAILLLAGRRSEISDDDEIRSQLASLPLVECSDKKFHEASAVYFPSQIVSEVLGDTVFQAVVPQEHQTTFTELFRWLHVAENPRFEDIAARVQTLVSTPPTPPSLASVRTIFSHLATRLQSGEATVALNALRALAWLPARRQVAVWFKPDELFAVFQDYLFESQANFLDIDRTAQNARHAAPRLPRHQEFAVRQPCC